MRDEAQAADAREWLAGEEDETAMTPERLAALEAAAADEDAPVAGRRGSARRGGLAGRGAAVQPGVGLGSVPPLAASRAGLAAGRGAGGRRRRGGGGIVAGGAGGRPRDENSPAFGEKSSRADCVAAERQHLPARSLPAAVRSAAAAAAPRGASTRRAQDGSAALPHGHPPRATATCHAIAATDAAPVTTANTRDRRLQRRQRRHEPDADRRDRDAQVDAHEERGRDLAAAVGRGDGVEVRLRAEERHPVADAAQQRGREDERQRVGGERGDERDQARRSRGARPTDWSRAGATLPRTTTCAAHDASSIVAVIAPSSARFDVSSSDPA